MIDLATEHWFPLPEAKKHLPTRPCYVTVWRWHRHGRRVGTRFVKLEAIPTSHGLVTSTEAYLRFQENYRKAFVAKSRG